MMPTMATRRQPVDEWVTRLESLLHDLSGAEASVNGVGLAPDPLPPCAWWRCTAGLTPLTVWIGATEPDIDALAKKIVVPASAASDALDAVETFRNMLDRSWTWNGSMVDGPPSNTAVDAYDVRFPGSDPIRLYVGLVERTFDPVANLDVLMDVELPVTLRFGCTQMPLRDLVSLRAGSIIEFDRALNDPVELMVNGRVIARGEAVIVQDNYGFRISEIASPRDRLSTSSLVPSRQNGASPSRGDL